MSRCCKELRIELKRVFVRDPGRTLARHPGDAVEGADGVRDEAARRLGGNVVAVTHDQRTRPQTWESS